MADEFKEDGKTELGRLIDGLAASLGTQRVGISSFKSRKDRMASLGRGCLKKLPKPELLPNSFREYKGQNRIKTLLQDTIASAVKRNAPIDHILLNGLPGQGKTTIAWLIAKDAKREIVTVTASAIDKPIDVYNIFKDVENAVYPIVFIDEIHGLKKPIAEMIYVPMETPNTVITFPSVYGSINCSILIKPFTLIGATTGEQGRLPRPLLDRIQLKLNMDPYTMADMESIINQSMNKLELSLPEQAIKEIAQRSSFIPRKANNLLRIIRNHVVSRDITRITAKDLKNVWALLELDDLGIDRIGRQILNEIADASRGSLGLRSLASTIGVDEKTLTKIYEPELISLGLIKFMPKGRAITERGLDYLGIGQIVGEPEVKKLTGEEGHGNE